MLDARKGFRADDPLRALGIRQPERPVVAAARPAGGFAVAEHPGFLTAAECRGLIALIEAARRPSTVAGTLADPDYRTSETCDLFDGTPLVDAVNRRLDALLGQPARHGEILQGQRYAPGQAFKLHTDYFEPDSPDYADHCAVGGQRTFTAMAYLNVPEAGGATHFEVIGRTFTPELGKLLVWSNLDAAGQPDYASLHEGRPVERGIKYIITKWYRERPVRA